MSIKHFILGAILLVAGFLFVHVLFATPHSIEGDHELCQAVREASYIIMTNRQQGTEYTIMMKDVEDSNLFTIITQDAFTYPQYLTETSQRTISNYFAEKHYEICMEGTR